MKWYGLLRDDELIAVQRFKEFPTVFEFKVGWNNQQKYEVVVIKNIDY